MKLRIEPGKIGYRLDFDELERLLAEGQLEEKLALPRGHLTYRVICRPAGAKATFETNEQGGEQAGGARFTLSLARDALEDHKAALPSLKGIVSVFAGANQSPVEVSLEINLKKKIKRALT